MKSLFLPAMMANHQYLPGGEHIRASRERRVMVTVLADLKPDPKPEPGKAKRTKSKKPKGGKP